MQIYRLSFTMLMKLIIFFTSCFTFLSIEANPNDTSGFSTVLIHRDSPLSPLSDPNLSNVQRQDIAFKRILQRYQTQGSSVLLFEDNSYLMKISYGNPPVEFFQEISTTTNLTWIQCEPCVHCFPSEQSPYPPNISHTFVYETCPRDKNKRCPYDIYYGEKAFSHGELARETIRVGSPQHKVKIDNFLFGCGHNNFGQYAPKGAGIVGFNLKESSFVSQLRSKHHEKIAYCMASPSSPHPGKISFGNKAVVSGDGVMKTPLIFDSSKYHVMLDGVTVATKKVKYFPYQYSSSIFLPLNHSRLHGGKMLIDTRRNIMILPPPLLQHVEAHLRDHIKAKPIVKASAPFTLCYPATLEDRKIPNIILHFPGVELVLSPSHTFMTLPTSERRCLAIFAEKRLRTPVLGNMAQVNFLVGYDLVEKTLAFKPIDCSSLRV